MWDLALAVLGAIGGVLLTIIAGQLSHKWKTYSAKQGTLNRLDELITEVHWRSYNEPDPKYQYSRVENEVWSQELEALARDSRNRIYGICIPLRTIAGRARRYNLTPHGANRDIYTYNDFLSDLYCLQLATTPPRSYLAYKQKDKIKWRINKFFTMAGGGLTDTEIEEKYAEWEKGDLNFGKERAAAALFQHVDRPPKESLRNTI